MMYLIVLIIALFTTVPPSPDIRNNRFEIYLKNDQSWIVREKKTGNQWRFEPAFIVTISPEDPKLAMRAAGIGNVMYNVVTWKGQGLEAKDQLKHERARTDVGGDGFDDRILKAGNEERTPDVFKAGALSRQRAHRHRREDGRITFSFPEADSYRLSAELFFADAEAFPSLQYTLEVKEESHYSVGYVGAPDYPLEAVSEIWQPMVWQEKRFPEKSFLTMAYQCPIPSTLVCASGACSGVVADPKEFPFDPLPLLTNSRFGIALRADDGKARPMLFAPVLGGAGSLMEKGSSFRFEVQLYVGTTDLTGAYETIARDIYQFKDYRKNTTHTLNQTLDNMLEYGMSKYSWFVDSLKGCAYSTDVPGAVKNVSALNPLQMALLADREDIYWKRAYPIMEFLISREKFLFSLDSTQKIQNPSRKMNGPVAPVSELSALYEISDEKSKALLDLARHEFNNSRTRNLSVEEPGDTWQNALALYKATGERQYLEKAIQGANRYLKERVNQPSENFDTTEKGFFFWNGFTPDWINLLLLYEATENEVYLDAAQKGARQYTLFSWFAPTIPDDSILVNEGNQAPLYWYLKAKGHTPMRMPKEVVPAWQLSEIGLTPESAGTCAGHRAIFMANYAPWMLRIGFLKNDDFLKHTARSAIIGRYANFPGYHMNTARTTAYEKGNYPLRPFKELSVNSFHFNHIWPHMSILVDYLFTDAFVKSEGNITVPTTFIEGYAYLQSKFYGHEPGIFYGERNVYPWMPPKLLTTGSKQLNYIAFRGNNSVYLVFMNQSKDRISSSVSLNNTLLPEGTSGTYQARTWIDNKPDGTTEVVKGKFQIQVNPGSISAIRIEGMNPKTAFQERFYQARKRPATGLISLKAGNAKAMILDFGDQVRNFYLFLRDDDRLVRKASLTYFLSGQRYHTIDDNYPFEFTVPIPEETADVKFTLEVTGTDGNVKAENIPVALEE